MHKRSYSLIAATAATLAIGVAVTSDARQTTGDSLRVKSGAPRTQTGSVAQSVQQQFGIFRRAKRPDDTLPKDVLITFTAGLNDRLGTNPALARRLGTSGAWVVPGDGFICVAQSGSAGCGPSSSAASGHFILTTRGEGLGLKGDETIVSGLMPDGVSSVNLTTETGKSVQAPVSDNGFDVVAPSRPTSAAFATAQGRRVVKLATHSRR
jgi:hypothetical protein